jgi:hypothetical protein
VKLEVANVQPTGKNSLNSLLIPTIWNIL